MGREVTYDSYLQLDKLMACQDLRRSPEVGVFHDETMFVIVHQAYELWFKLILHELKTVCRGLSGEEAGKISLSLVVRRLERVEQVVRLCVEQFRVLETMSCAEFTAFREHLGTASGAQSRQYRMVEQMLGYGRTSEHGIVCCGTGAVPRPSNDTLFEALEDWLQQLPLSGTETRTFWRQFRSALKTHECPGLSELMETMGLEQRGGKSENGSNLLGLYRTRQRQEGGDWRLSNRAFRAVLFLRMSPEAAPISLAQKLLDKVAGIDKLFFEWRGRHVTVARQMIGDKPGTGGTTGSRYLASRVGVPRAFVELTDLPRSLISRAKLPEISPAVACRVASHLAQGSFASN
jgi:tryptophan 2,3-dioxygenase